MLVAAYALQIVAIGLLSAVPASTTKIEPAEYRFEVLLGLGLGAINTSIILISRSIVEGKDQGRASHALPSHTALPVTNTQPQP